MKNIGDEVWIARLRHTEVSEKCPDCLGTAKVKLTLPNGESHDLECQTCNPGGYQHSNGYLKKNQYVPSANKVKNNQDRIRRRKNHLLF